MINITQDNIIANIKKLPNVTIDTRYLDSSLTDPMVIIDFNKLANIIGYDHESDLFNDYQNNKYHIIYNDKVIHSTYDIIIGYDSTGGIFITYDNPARIFYIKNDMMYRVDKMWYPPHDIIKTDLDAKNEIQNIINHVGYTSTKKYTYEVWELSPWDIDNSGHIFINNHTGIAYDENGVIMNEKSYDQRHDDYITLRYNTLLDMDYIMFLKIRKDTE